jgi:uncharacterized protein YndB with AHSA1/START domain
MNRLTTQASIVDREGFSVRRTIRIGAPVEKVWSAVTDPAHISRWFAKTTLVGTGAGATGTMAFGPDDVIPMRVEELDAPHRVSYRWNNDDALGYRPEVFDEATATVFTFTLEPLDDGAGTLLTLVESGFDRTSDADANMEYHRTGWDAELDKLAALVEAEAASA